MSPRKRIPFSVNTTMAPGRSSLWAGHQRGSPGPGASTRRPNPLGPGPAGSTGRGRPVTFRRLSDWFPGQWKGFRNLPHPQNRPTDPRSEQRTRKRRNPANPRDKPGDKPTNPGYKSTQLPQRRLAVQHFAKRENFSARAALHLFSGESRSPQQERAAPLGLVSKGRIRQSS